MANHGIYVRKADTAVSTPAVAASGIPCFVGAAPAYQVDPTNFNKPVLCASLAEFKEKFGWSDAWWDESGAELVEKYTLCEAAYSHFVLFGMQPAIFINVLDASTMYDTVAAADKTVADHQAALDAELINDGSLVVKAAEGTGDAYVKGTDYKVSYNGDHACVELLSGSAHYGEAKLNIAYRKAKLSGVTATEVAAGFDYVEDCLTSIGVVPDLLVAPGWSGKTTVAAAMAAKAEGINGMFEAMALVDISTSASGGANSYDKVVALKNTDNITDAKQIVCWPLLTLGGKVYHMSTQLAGLMAEVDTENSGIPYESPSNKALQMDGMCVLAKTPVALRKAQADALNAGGIVTALSFMGGFVAWGNYTACYPSSTDVSEYFISLNRMFGWIGAAEIKTFWAKLDSPMTRIRVDSIVNSLNMWLNGLVGSNYLLGARAEFLDEENPETDLMAGKVKIHNYVTPPSPMQEIDFINEYDASYVSAAFSG